MLYHYRVTILNSRKYIKWETQKYKVFEIVLFLYLLFLLFFTNLTISTIFYYFPTIFYKEGTILNNFLHYLLKLNDFCISINKTIIDIR